MDYFSVNYSPRVKLGIHIKARTDNSLPWIGFTVIDKVDVDSFSQKGGVSPNDFIISVNDQYVAFDKNRTVIELLKSVLEENSQMCIVFSRPSVAKWSEIYQNPNAKVKEGNLLKQNHSVFKKWNQRLFVLTRDNLTVYSDNSLKCNFSIQSDVQKPRIAAGYANQSGVFELRCGDKNYILQAENALDKNVWMHCIDCCVEKSFFSPLDVVAGRHASQPTLSNNPTANLPDGANSYLQLGRFVQEKRSQTQNSTDYNGNSLNSTRGLARKKSSDFATNYKMLTLSKVKAAAGPENSISVDGVKDPSTITISFPEYSFNLENSILNKLK